VELWREQHPGAWEQMALDFNRPRDFGHFYAGQFSEIPE
jgi:hypothetical protein